MFNCSLTVEEVYLGYKKIGTNNSISISHSHCYANSIVTTCLLFCSSEANDLALQIAQAVSGHSHIIALEG